MTVGRPSPLHGWSERKVAHFIALWTGDNDLTVADFGRLFRIGETTVYAYATKLGIKRHPEAVRRKQRKIALQNRAKVAARLQARKAAARAHAPWPPHRFEDEPRIAARWARATPLPLSMPAPDRTLGGVASGVE